MKRERTIKEFIKFLSAFHLKGISAHEPYKGLRFGQAFCNDFEYNGESYAGLFYETDFKIAEANVCDIVTSEFKSDEITPN